MKKHYVYMLRCRDGSLYTGYTSDLEARVRAHNGEGRGGAKYTRARRPVVLVYHETYEEKGSALSRECEIKKLTRVQKEALVATQEAQALAQAEVQATVQEAQVSAQEEKQTSAQEEK